MLKQELDGASDTYQEKKQTHRKVSINKVAENRKKDDVSPRFLIYAEKIADEVKYTGHIRNGKNTRTSATS